MNSRGGLALAIALSLLAAPACSCRGKAVQATDQRITVKYRLAPGAVAKPNPQKGFRCTAYVVTVINRGYDTVAFDGNSFVMEVDGTAYSAAGELTCPLGAASDTVKIGDGRSWQGTVAFEHPHFTYEARVLLKPSAVRDAFVGNAVPRIEYEIDPARTPVPARTP